MNLPIYLDTESKVPIYQQLSLVLQETIESGRLRAGDLLPPEREFARDLGLARGTVSRAYNELECKGYIESKSGVGTVVSKQVPLDGAPLGEYLSGTDSVAPFNPLVLSQFAQRVLQQELIAYTSADLPQLNYGCTPQELLPVKQWRELLSKYCHPDEASELVYVTEPFGYRPLRGAVARYLVRTKGLKCHPDQVVVFSGSQMALNEIIQVLIDPGDLVVIEDPGYVGARDNFLAHGARLKAIPIDDDGMRIEQLDDLYEPCKLAYLTPSGQDPTGAVLSHERRLKLLDWAQQSGVLIIEDAWDTEYSYGTSAPSLQGMSTGNSVLYLYTFWKVLFPLTTLSVVVVPPDLISVFTRVKLLTERQGPSLESFALTDFINEGHLERQIRYSRKIYQQRRQTLIFTLTKCFGRAINIVPRSAGMHQMLQFHFDKSEREILQCAGRAGLPIVPTGQYYIQKPIPNEFLIPFACVDEEALRAAVELFARLLLEP